MEYTKYKPLLLGVLGPVVAYIGTMHGPNLTIFIGSLAIGILFNIVGLVFAIRKARTSGAKALPIVGIGINVLALLAIGTVCYFLGLIYYAALQDPQLFMS
jgi:hypothetical protein